MASHAPITGAPTGASSNVVTFPDIDARGMRVRLRFCTSDRMFDRWANDLRKLRGKVTETDYAELVACGATRRFMVANGLAS